MASNLDDSVIFSTVFGPLDEDQTRALHELADLAKRNDGSPPFSDQTLLSVAQPQNASHQIVILLKADDNLIGAAIANDGVMELVVLPNYRNQGYASALITEMQRAFIEQPARIKFTDLNVWAHGKQAAALKLAQSAGFQPVRELWKMTISADHPFPEPTWSKGIKVRTFVVGQDDQEWLKLNAQAFASHPEQGKMTLADLQVRQTEPWFRADGFFLAEDTNTGELLGFHWTKLEPPVGEVYVVGVSPEAQGRGLGKSLTLAGLKFLQQHCEIIELYVDADNAPAVALYKQLGFKITTIDIMFKHSSQST